MMHFLSLLGKDRIAMALFTDHQISQYLDKIDYRGGTEPTLEHLTAMHRQHLLHIPYENLDLMNGIPLNLDAEALFQKIIVNRKRKIMRLFLLILSWVTMGGYTTAWIKA